jgi:antitoxin YefM
MSTITYSAAREKFAETMDRVCDNHQPIVVTRQKRRSVVILSLEDYEALNETAYLLRSPANARRLLAATQQLESRRGKSRTLDLVE